MEQPNKPDPDKDFLLRMKGMRLAIAKAAKANKTDFQYLTDAQQKNSEAAMKQLEINKNLKIDWDAEAERQKRNATD